MSDFDYSKIKDMKYDPDRGCYVGKDGDEFHVKRYSNGKVINMTIMIKVHMKTLHIIQHILNLI